MNAEAAAKIGLRLLAVFFIGLGMDIIPEYVALFEGAIPGVSVSGNLDWYMTLIFSPMTFGVLLWFVAVPASRWTTHGMNGVENSAPFDGAALQTAAFATLGMYFFIQNFPLLLGLIGETLSGGTTLSSARVDNTAVIYNRLWVTALKVMLGLALLLGAQFFTRLVLRFRQFGLPPAAPSE